jgi:diguanylate cyclase (GGDEF)-like protein
MTATRSTVLSGRTVVIGYAVAVVLFVALLLVHPAGVLVIAGMLPMVAALVGCRLHKIEDRLPWHLLMAGMCMLTIVNASWCITVDVLGRAPPSGSLPIRLLQMGGYIAILGSSIVVVMRHAPQVGGGVVDAALIGTGLAAPVWAILLHPRLDADGTSVAGQVVPLVQTFVLLATAGALLRISRSTRQARSALNLFIVSLASTVLGLIGSVVFTDPTTGEQSVLVTVFWVVGYLSQAAAALHPSAAALTEPSESRPDELSATRLTQLGAVLLVSPIVGGLPYLFGVKPDILLLSLGPLLTVPLVLVRFAQLNQQRTRDQQTLAFQATHDDLTGLANRRHLMSLAGDATDRLRSGELPALSVLYGDLDGFKPINDRLGHDAGDHVLQAVSERLRSVLRDGDQAGRIGGDEFLLLCPGLDLAGARAVRRRVDEVMAEPIVWRGMPLDVGITIGVAAADNTTVTCADDLITAADESMYARKRERRRSHDRYAV